MACSTPDIPQISDLQCIVEVIIRNLLTLGGIIFFITLIVGGFQFLTSGGSPDAVSRAQKTLTFAVIGLVTALLSYTILLAIEYVTGAQVTQFSFYGS